MSTVLSIGQRCWSDEYQQYVVDEEKMQVSGLPKDNTKNCFVSTSHFFVNFCKDTGLDTVFFERSPYGHLEEVGMQPITQDVLRMVRDAATRWQKSHDNLVPGWIGGNEEEQYANYYWYLLLWIKAWMEYAWGTCDDPVFDVG